MYKLKNLELKNHIFQNLYKFKKLENNNYEVNVLKDKNIPLEKTYFDEKGIDKIYPYISTNKKCDVLIIGGGICGALAAYYQIKRGNKVIVVDKNIIAYENTKRCPGIIRKNISINDYLKIKNGKISSKIKRLYEDSFVDFEKIIGDLEISEATKNKVNDISFIKKDMIYYSDRVVSKHNMYKDYENMLNKYSKSPEDTEYIEQDKYINLKCGIKEKDSVATFNPYEFTRILFEYLTTCKNVEIYEHTSIENIVNVDDIVEAITDNKFKIYAKKIIITSGIYSMKDMKNTDTIIDIYKTYNMITEPLYDINKDEVNFVGKSVIEPYEYITLTEDNRIQIIGADIRETNRVFEDTKSIYLTKGKYKGLLKLLNQIFLLPEDIKITNCYTSTYLRTKDDLPIIDEFDNMPNVYTIIPSGKCNLNYCIMGAKMLSDITREFHIKDMTIFRMDR